MKYIEHGYDRMSALNYAHQWSFGRNPMYYDFSEIGGDCTNFASQCIFAGSKIMNHTNVTGWYYINSNMRSASWSGVKYLYNFLVQNNGIGPYGKEVQIEKVMPGDIIQLATIGLDYHHTQIIVDCGKVPDVNNILVATHSFDSDYRQLLSYNITKVRYIKILGIRYFY